MRPLLVFLLTVLLLAPLAGPATAAPEGTLTWGVHVTLAPRWLDPRDTEAFITPFLVLYAIHDALVKPMPAGDNTPSLAESWTVSKDGLIYEFVLRKGVKFHNGDPVTVAVAGLHDLLWHVRHRRGVDRAAVPEIEDLYHGQAKELDPKKREAMLHQIQQIVHDRVMYVPIYELAFL